MIYGVGTDIIEIRRIAAARVKHPGFVGRIYTVLEQQACLQKGDTGYAGRFAAKEAVAKALGCGFGSIAFREIEIVADAAGVPRVHCLGVAARYLQEQQISRIHLTISHCREYATAVAVAETKEDVSCVY